MLGKLHSVGDNHFMTSIKQDPLIVVLDIISVKPRTLKATVRKHDLMLVQSMEREITTLFGDTSYKQCGFSTSDELNGFIDDTFTSSCGLHELKDGMINLTLDSPLSGNILPDTTHAMSIRPVKILGSPHVLKIVWKAKRVSLPKHNPTNETSEKIASSLDAIENKVRELKDTEDTIDVISWLNEHNFHF